LFFLPKKFFSEMTKNQWLTGLFLAFALVLRAQAPFSLPELGYAFKALEPHVDAQTMEIHHGKHHQAYVNNLNKALTGHKYEKLALTDLLLRAGRAGDAVRNNAGGHYNHTHFWRVLAPGGRPLDPSGKFGQALTATFGSLDSLKKTMSQAGLSRFGSGWAWLYLTTDKKLAVCSSPNQDNPIMDVSKERGIPILGIDVWEHAYYLKYQNKRGDYLSAVWNVINWEEVAKNYEIALNDPLLRMIELDAWAELKDFHQVMAQTFHPAEEGDLQPIRARIGEMHAKALLLQAGKIPASFDNASIRDAIGRLVSGSAELEKLIGKKAKDETVKEKITKLHDVFHEIQGLCFH
jgi:superoxide dismutase